MRAARSRPGQIVAGVAGVIALLLGLGQLLLPGITATRISSRVGRYGMVKSVSVEAWPAVELLWGVADSVKVRATSLKLSPAQTAKLVWEARGVNDLEMTAPSVREGPLQLSDVRIRKRGSAVSAHARITSADVKAALPGGFEVRLLRSEGGRVEVRAGGGLFGVGASVDAVAGASEGKLVAHPLGFALRRLQITLFADPHVYLEGVGASVEAGQPLSYRLTVRARLR